MNLKNINCRYCGSNAYRLALTAMLQDAGAYTNNPADRCWMREEGLPHDFDEPVKQTIPYEHKMEEKTMVKNYVVIDGAYPANPVKRSEIDLQIESLMREIIKTRELTDKLFVKLCPTLGRTKPPEKIDENLKPDSCSPMAEELRGQSFNLADCNKDLENILSSCEL